MSKFTEPQKRALQILPTSRSGGTTTIGTDRASLGLANRRTVEFYAEPDGSVSVWVCIRPEIAGRAVTMALYAGAVTEPAALINAWRGASSLASYLRTAPQANGYVLSGSYTDSSGNPAYVYRQSAAPADAAVAAFVARNGLAPVVEVETSTPKPTKRRLVKLSNGSTS